MEKVNFLPKRGKRVVVFPRNTAEMLERGRLGAIVDRSMQGKPQVLKAADDLDDMTAEQLHELAKSRGIDVHHRAGAERVRAALRESAK